jgi:RND family efflux transporter MFP subunit
MDKNITQFYKTKHFFYSVGFVALGLTVFLLFKITKPQVAKKPVEFLPPLVEVKKLHKEDMEMIIKGFGTVRSQLNVEIVPQVAGNVVNKNPQFREGGFIPAGQTIVQIDPSDYELSVRQANAAVAQARVKLETEQAEAIVAEQEWYALNPNTEPNNPLVLRKPQIRQAQAELESALAKLTAAQLSLDRTVIKMPIDLCISKDEIDLGQLATVGKSIGSGFGTEKAEVQVPLEDKDLKWFDTRLNSKNANESLPSKVIIEVDFAGGLYQWDGKVTRTVGQVDLNSRMVDIVIEIDKPFNNPDKPDLLPGTFVEVSIIGHTVENVFKIPRDAVHKADTIWLMNDGKLKIKQINIVRADKDFAYTTEGLQDGDMVIISPMDTVVDEMKIRAVTAETTKR